MTGAGRYRYCLDGVLQGIDEPCAWTLTPDGARLHGRRELRGKTLFEVDATYVDGACRAFTVHWHDSARVRAAHYRIDGHHLRWQVDADAQALDLPDDCLMFPLLRAATGPLLRRLIDAPRPVLVPRLHDPQAPDFLAPLLSTRSVQRHSAPGAVPQHLRYFGGEYGDAGCDCWIDAEDRLVRYVWDTAQGRWDVHWQADR